MIEHLDIAFAQTDTGPLFLNLFIPSGVERPPLLVMIHGGGWHKGSYNGGVARTDWLIPHGFALARIGYRLTDRATFPAQIHDCKAAIRWLRAHAEEYGYNVSRIAALGSSAGGHLAMLLGTTTGRPEYEGTIGGNLDQSSHVDAVVSFAGPSEFVLRARVQPEKTELLDAPVYKLLGGPVSQNEALAKMASPAWQVGPDAVPLLMLHGTGDKTVFFDQSEQMLAAYRKQGRPCELIPVPDARHGDPRVFSPPYHEPVLAFINQHLRVAEAPR